MKIYDSTGYVNVKGILDQGYPFNFLVGGRGTGKTYTALKVAKEDGRKFVFMRRTQTQADIISKPEFSVFKPLNADLDWDVKVRRISKYNSEFYEMEGETARTVGYTCALSTISNMRGFDASDIDLLIYDEFIPEKHERLMKNEADALFNAYETMNRNRELQGRPPLQMICLANSNDIANPIFESLKLIRLTDKMQKSGREWWTDDKRGLLLVMLYRSPVSQRKGDTALYNLTSGTQFAEMALSNDFNVERSHIRPRPLQEYAPLCTIGEACIYRHKADNRLYVTTHLSGVFREQYGTGETDKLHYQRTHHAHWDLYIANKMDFEDVLAETLFLRYWA